MKIIIFAKRNLKEILRDISSVLFGVCLPLFLLLLITLVQKSITVDIFELNIFTPGIAVFSFSFLSLFSAMLISKDKSTSFLTRLFASPMKSKDYIIGYSLPLIPLAIAQSILCFSLALIMGLSTSFNILLAIIILIPVSLLFVAFGLLLGIIFSDKQVGVFSSILVQVAALSSGMWFPLDIIGGALKTICYILPFAHAVDAVKFALQREYSKIIPNIIWVLGYALIIFIIAIILFKNKMRK